MQARLLTHTLLSALHTATQVKTAKPHLKQLQQCVQSLSTQTDDKVDSTAVSGFSGVEVQPAEDFFWLTKHHAYITVYLVSSAYYAFISIFVTQFWLTVYIHCGPSFHSQSAIRNWPTILASCLQVSVFHSVQAGLTEKALLYISRALDLIQQEDGTFPART